MSDRERAIAALRKAGFKKSDLATATYLRDKGPGGTDMCMLLDGGRFDLGIGGEEADLPSLLSPSLTLEDVEKALSDEYERVADPAYFGVIRSYWWGVMERLRQQIGGDYE